MRCASKALCIEISGAAKHWRPASSCIHSACKRGHFPPALSIKRDTDRQREREREREHPPKLRNSFNGMRPEPEIAGVKPAVWEWQNTNPQMWEWQNQKQQARLGGWVGIWCPAPMVGLKCPLVLMHACSRTHVGYGGLGIPAFGSYPKPLNPKP